MHTTRSRSRTLVAILLAVGSPAAADILLIDGATLTSYKAAGATTVQDVRLSHERRGVNLEGSLRATPAFGWRLAANPFEGGAGSGRLGDLDLSTGAYAPVMMDFARPAEVVWPIGRTYNGQQMNGLNPHTSDGAQGKNQFQMSQPELRFYDVDPAPGTRDAEDRLYLIYGADRFVEFARSADDSDDFRAVNGAAGAASFTTVADGMVTYNVIAVYDQHGTKSEFLGFSDANIDDDAEGQLWRITDPAGNRAYVGHETSITSALSGYDADGRILVAHDSAGGRYTYDYDTIDSAVRLVQVLVEIDENGGGWGSAGTETEVARVDYSYYQTGDTTHGDAGTLKQVRVRTALSDSGTSLGSGVYLERKTLYRYWTGAYNASTNPGHAGMIRLVVEAEGVRNYDWGVDAALDDDHFTASTDTLKPYAAAYLEYESDTTTRRVSSAFFNGECGCAGGANGTYTFTYDEASGAATNAANTVYDEEWAARTVIEQPDGTFVTRYFDEAGQPLSTVITPTDPAAGVGDFWATVVTRDATSGTSPGGLVTQIATPAAVSAYTHDTMGSPDGSLTVSASAGLIHLFVRATSNETIGFVTSRRFREAGTGGTAYYQGDTTYTTASMAVGSLTLYRPLVATSEQDVDQIAVGGVRNKQPLTITSVAGSGAAALTVNKTTSEADTVTTGNNGSGSATSTKRYSRADGSTALTETAGGIFTYSKQENGLVVEQIRDVQTNHATAFAAGDDPNTAWGISESGSGLHLRTVFTYDRMGRPDTTTTYQDDGTTVRRATKMYYSRLADGRTVTVSIPRFTTGGSTTYFGPASYMVSNLAGQAEFSGTIAITSSGTTTALSGWVDETDGDPILALQVGTLARMSTSLYDESGTKVEESRAYFDIPASGAGADGTNYDATFFGYDAMGRRWRTKAPHGTITRTVFDELGRAVESWVGTNDSSFSGGEASGTDTMTKTSVTEYDGGNDQGNSYVTSVTLDPDGNWATATDQRVTAYTRDARGRAILTASPQAPHALVKLDNLGRTVAAGLYSSTSGLTASSDPTSVTSNRVALSQTFYDERGMVWKTQRDLIDVSDGSDDGDLVTQTWYDADGRAIKTSGAQFSKTVYDRLGRATHRYTLATVNDTVYADADDVSGDIVLEEHQSVYENDTGSVLFTASIQRHHDDLSTGTTGALDTGADTDRLTLTDTDVEGRAQITAMWYDALDRLTDQARYGTNDPADGIGTFTRGGSAPSRSDTVLVTSYVYNDDGTVQDVTDPKGLVTRTLYDDLGRAIATIANYVNGTPSSATGDDDVYTRFTYADGLRTEHWVDIDGDGAKDVGVDQVTTSTHGTTKGVSAGDSQVARGDLLQKITYPDSSSGTDVVSFAYNALGQEVWKKDQIGTVIETDLDTAGRRTHERVTTLGTGVDGAVLRNSLTYNSRGMVETVTQYDNATVGSGSVVNEVKNTYGIHNLITLQEQDHNSAVGASGSVDDYEVAHAYTVLNDRQLRRTSTTLPGSLSVTYFYAGSGGPLDSGANRVTSLIASSVTLVEYDYNGLGTVVGTEHPEPDVFSELYARGGTSGEYPRLDRFNRVLTSSWMLDRATDRDMHKVDLAYDRASNITSATDGIHTSSAGTRQFDVLYALDGLQRVTDADEGSLSAGAISSRTRRQQWTLAQPGAIARDKVDLNGDGDWGDANEMDDSRTFNVVNELTARDTDSNAVTNYTPAYDAAGNLTDDGVDHDYVYDAWYRLVKAKNQAGTTVAEYGYDGLNRRVTWRYDTDTDGDVDGSDQTYHLVYDERWRQVATYRGSDASVKERFVSHAAGLGGMGSSSYIDAVILRDRDNTNGWTGAADGTLEERRYYLQNWRGDVSVVVKETGAPVEFVKYSAYGVPFGISWGDSDSSGAATLQDVVTLDTWRTAGTYDYRGDLDGDSDVDSTDVGLWNSAGGSLGRGVLTRSDTGNRRGYAGYEHAPELAGTKWHARHRVLDSVTGAWLSRDPKQYHDSMDLYAYVAGRVVVGVDPMGLTMISACGIAGLGSASATNTRVVCRDDSISPHDGSFCPPREQGLSNKLADEAPPYGGDNFSCSEIYSDGSKCSDCCDRRRDACLARSDWLYDYCTKLCQGSCYGACRATLWCKTRCHGCGINAIFNCGTSDLVRSASCEADWGVCEAACAVIL